MQQCKAHLTFNLTHKTVAVILQHMCVFLKVLQVCSPQIQGDVQILPERSALTVWLIALIFLPDSGKLNICQGQVWNLPWLGPACHSFLWYFYFKMWCKQPGELNLLKSLRQTVTTQHDADMGLGLQRLARIQHGNDYLWCLCNVRQREILTSDSDTSRGFSLRPKPSVSTAPLYLLQISSSE